MRRQLIRAALPLLLLPTVLGPAAPAQAGKPFVGSIVLPGATSAEGVAAGAGNTFFAGDLFAGDIFRGDVRAGTASLFIDAPAGRQALGMKVDVAHHLLFVAGGFTGQAYVYRHKNRRHRGDLPDGHARFVNHQRRRADARRARGSPTRRRPTCCSFR
jgi:hypothetical protein